MIRFLLVFLVLASSAVARDVKRPALYDVTGVAANDVLNLRETPGAGAAKVGALSPDARNVEVVAVDDTAKWGLVALPESSGWASLRFLARQGGQDDTSMPPLPLSCSGTEPFWALDINNHRATFRPYDGASVTESLDWTGPPQGSVGIAYGLIGGDGISGVIERRACSDGMSDRPFGLSIMAIVRGPTGPELFSGCCSLQ